jgi:hypothetical protein
MTSEFLAVVESLSPERLQKYLEASAGNWRRAIRLYEHNMALSEAFYPCLQCLEICLRNRLNNAIREKFGEDWLFNDTDPLGFDTMQDIEKAQKSIAKDSFAQGDIVAQLNFGFWIGLLGPRYDATIWRQAAFRAFANARTLRQKTIHNRLNALRRLRNRIAHHEPIFDRPLAQLHDEAIETIGWMCRETSAWSANQSRLPLLINARGQGD